MSALETAARPKVSKRDKLPAIGSMQKRAGVEAEVEQVGVELDARDARVTELEACAKKLTYSLEHSASRKCVAECKCLLLYHETESLKQRLATDVSCDGKTEQCFINANKVV